MAQANEHFTTSKQNHDAALLAMVDQHDALWGEWDRITDFGKNEDPRTRALSDECYELERKITATPAFTREGLAGKRRVIRRAEFEDDSGVIATILELDAERVAAR
ncbi:hypothetical protein [Bradyrhizobium japonicum]|uniref:hypothetical protein n=1 Tax=Bradyrhizobium japonicum TaxID=375 RepID=UPI000456CAFD|nr:hypothetical protein [Bradyrhizobium japonicum]AHY52480.1 hypothetical protein BJS_05958 [Bradyrhizobium japonicum SEMIA 5079]MCD9110267.1 hypothetical protein [Bradyrhizobium japonicum]MCD9257446.1 hypothetical protein [Bradyrhizobium japonicum SEMIA 5079]MCD9823507.1 hypothetical protein [Bradyrhizobium japonicum]MCD9895109.1 hypothetical protein [Bradyrhizobium japonicum]